MTSLAVLIGRGLLSARPAAGTPGSLYYATDTATLYRDNGASWDSVEGAGGLTNPMTAAGDLIVGGASGTPTRLAAGSATNVLTMVAGAPAWAAASGGGAFSGCRAYSSAAQSLAPGVDTALTLDSERFDTDGYHDTVTNTSRLTVPTGLGGYYWIGGTVAFAANATGQRSAQIRLNGATAIVYADGNAAGGSLPHAIIVSTLFHLADADYVELIGWQSSGGALSTAPAGDYAPEFMLQRMG